MNKLANITALAFAALLFTACGGSESPIPEAAAATRRPLTVVIGDSITAGYIPAAGVLQLRQDLSYTADVAQLGDVVTAAVGGASTQAALGTQVPWLRSLPADVLVIMLGTNDAVLQLDRAKALANVSAIADAWPKARLVLVAPPYWDAAAAPWLSAWSADLRKLAAERGARFVDAYAATRSDWLCHPTDRHPCEAAHREIGALVRLAAFAP
jgi:lysophospholipase L1-like esterase